MSKTKSSALPHYELLYLVSNQFAENELEPIKAKVEKLITDNEGVITYREDWGKRKIAYPIKGFRHGYYFLLEFDLTGVAVNKLDNSLRLANDILRHQIVVKKKLSDAEREAEKKNRAKLAEEAKAAAEADEPITIAPVSKEKSAVAKAMADKDDESKIELKDLDQKLENILDTKDLI